MRIDGSKFAVVGGAGLIGSHTVDLLLKEGVGEVVVLDNFERGSRENLELALKDPRLRVVHGDLRQVFCDQDSSKAKSMKRRNEDGEKGDAGKRSLYSFFGEVTLPGCDPSCPSCTYKNVNTATTCHLCSTSLLPTPPTQATQENGGEDDRLASLEGGILTDASSTAAPGFESPISRAWASSSSSASGTSPPASAPASAAPTDGAVLQWADTIVSITTRGLSAVNATIGLSIRSYQRAVDDALRRMDTRAEEAASQAASDVEAAKEEALKQMGVNAASLEAGIERAILPSKNW